MWVVLKHGPEPLGNQVGSFGENFEREGSGHDIGSGRGEGAVLPARQPSYSVDRSVRRGQAQLELRFRQPTDHGGVKLAAGAVEV